MMSVRVGSTLFFLAAAGANAGDSIPAITVHASGSARPGNYTVEERLAEFGPTVRQRLAGAFAAAGVTYPPHEVTYVAFKDVRHLEVYARGGTSGPWRFIKDYRIRGASGTLGPKLAEGDRQVPEGIYRADSLNPNSRYHLSIRVNYPNAYDLEVARRDGREHLGGDIMIHGARLSDGCLAMGDEAVEELFVLAALIGEQRVRIVISPTDFRDPTSRVPGIVLPWLRDLYLALRTELQQYPAQHGRQ